MRQKKIPMRKCTGCNEMKEKNQLVRIVKTPDTVDKDGNILETGKILIDITGKKSGRGAYVCKSPECLAAAKKARRLERAFSCKIPEEIYNSLSEQLNKN